MKRANENSYLKSTCSVYSWRGKKNIKQASHSLQHYYLLILHELWLISNLKKVIMESGFNIYADLKLPLREVLKTLKGSEWQYAVFWLKEVFFFNSLIALLTLCTKKQHFGAIQKINQPNKPSSSYTEKLVHKWTRKQKANWQAKQTSQKINRNTYTYTHTHKKKKITIFPCLDFLHPPRNTLPSSN